MRHAAIGRIVERNRVISDWTEFSGIAGLIEWIALMQHCIYESRHSVHNRIANVYYDKKNPY